MSQNKVVKAGVGYTIGNILIKGISFLTLPIFTRLMSTSDFGIYTTYVSYESILALIVGLGLYVSLKAAKVEYKTNLDEYVATVVLLPLFVSFIILLFSFPFLNQISSLLGFEGDKTIIICLIGQAFGTSAILMYNGRISLDYSYVKYIVLALVSTVGNVAISLVLILTVFKDRPYLGRILGTCLPVVFISLILYIFFLRRAKPNFDKDYLHFGLTYSLPLVPHGLSQVALAQFGKIVIQRTVGNSAAGIYGFAYTIALIPQILVSSLDTVWGPWFFEQYEKENINEIKQRTNVYVSFFSLVTILFFCVSPEIVKIMAPDSYQEAVIIMCPAILGVFFTFLYGIPAQVEYYLKKTGYIAVGTIFSAIINIVLCIFIIPRFGYKSAVYITLGTYMLYFVFHLFISNMITDSNPPYEIKTLLGHVCYVIVICIVMHYCISFWYIRYLVLLLCIGLFSYFFKDSIRIVLMSFLNSNNNG